MTILPDALFVRVLVAAVIICPIGCGGGSEARPPSPLTSPIGAEATVIVVVRGAFLDVAYQVDGGRRRRIGRTTSARTAFIVPWVSGGFRILVRGQASRDWWPTNELSISPGDSLEAVFRGGPTLYYRGKRGR